MRYIGSILFMTISSLITTGCQAKSQFNVANDYNGVCKFDYEEFDFCDASALNQYKKSIKKMKPNFYKKYILLEVNNIGYFVVIDPINKNVFPLLGNYGNPLDDSHKKEIGKRVVNFSLNSNKICFDGSREAYRASFNSGKFCYKFNGKDFEQEFNVDTQNSKNKIQPAKQENKANTLSVKEKYNFPDFSNSSQIILPTSSEDFNLCANIQKKPSEYCLEQEKKKRPYLPIAKIKNKEILNWLNSKEISSIHYDSLSILPKKNNSQSVVFVEYIPLNEDEDYTNYTLVNINNTGNQIIHLGEKYWIDKDLNISFMQRGSKIKEYYKLDNTGIYVKSQR